ncbi:MAG: 16S rRNA (cytosine(967)-C(5))-methyltransferase RsmB [Clostridiales bacterium]|nr:16S rRNA (cytosine(967)-C(5))-methyltransferase RsmB [Clostridiales bacterium]
MPLTGREAALKSLSGFRRSEIKPDRYLDSLVMRGLLPDKETALAYRLCMGVLQNANLCDYYIKHYLSSSIRKLHPAVLDILRLTTYQIVFLSRIPIPAAVNEGVKLARKYGAASLVNAVSRKIAENRENLPEVTGDTPADYLSVKYSHPKKLVEYVILRLGEAEAEQFLCKNNETPPITVRRNALLSSEEELKNELTTSGIVFRPHPWMDDFYDLQNPGNIQGLPFFLNGHCTVQDPASALVVYAAGVKENYTVLDACASPGGKTFLLAQIMRNTGHILACDRSEKKIGYINDGLKRLGIQNTECAVMDAKEQNNALVGTFDAVLCDVPCSGMGVIAKKPEIRYKSPESIQELPEIQLAILRNTADYVKAGGVLVYSTCTIMEAENENVIRSFLGERSDYTLETFRLPEPISNVPNGFMTLWPHYHKTDGFFICKLRKTI